VAGKEIFIHHCQNEQAARELQQRIKETYPSVLVKIVSTRGLDSFYAERHGLIVGF